MLSNNPRRLVVGVAAGAMLGLSVAGVSALAYQVLRQMRPPRLWPPPPGDVADLAPERVSFDATDGVRLHGWYCPAGPGADTLVLCHGYAMSRLETHDLALALRRLGHDVLLFDFRAHGESRGLFSTFGYRECEDLLGAVQFLEHRGFPGRLGVLGLSMGAVAAIRAAARCSTIVAIVADSSYASLDRLVLHRLRRSPHLSNTTLARFLVQVARHTIGPLLALVSPVADVARLAPRPVLLIHGEKDTVIPLVESQALYAAAGEPRLLWIVPGAGHVESRLVAADEYLAIVHEFFARSLR